MDLLMKTRLKTIARELGFQLTEGSFSKYELEYNDPAHTTNKHIHCLRVSVSTGEVSKALLLSWTTRETWLYAVQHFIAEFIRETQGDLIDDSEEA